MKQTIPGWANKFKTEGTQIIRNKDNYYLYKISSKWDKEKKRAKKITEKYLGKVTKEGIIKPKYERVNEISSNITLKEYGSTKLMQHLCSDIKDTLEKVYPTEWHTLFSFSMLRFFESSPIKNLHHYFLHSVLSDTYPEAKMMPKNISSLLEKIGCDREKMIEYMKSQLVGSENLIVDLTNIFSSSENITWLSIGHNSEEVYHEQFNLLLLFSRDKTMPVFFRVIDGAIRDISSIKKTIEESGVKNAVFVGDKGFFSEGNEEALSRNEIEHILPLRRNSTIINYDASNSSTKKAFDGFFFFNKRPIWHKTTAHENKKIILFFDEDLKADEARSFLFRVNKKEETIDEFHEREHKFGTIAVSVSSKDMSAEKVFQYLKARMQIEVAFDTFKNILEADKTYMQSNEKLYGWMFVNFIALQMYYKIYGNLVNNDLIESFSPKDVVMHFAKVYRVKIGEKLVISEVPKKTRILIEKMKLPEDILLK